MMRDGWLALFLLAVVAGSAWFWWQNRQLAVEAPEPPIAIEEEVVQPAVRDEPVYLVPTPSISNSGELVSLPSLADSDAWFLLELNNLFGGQLERLLKSDTLIERFVITVDNLPSPQMAERIRVVLPVAGNLQVSNDQLDAANYERYDLYVRRFMDADIDSLMQAYQRFYPLLQEAYESLGYPDAYFNDRLVEVIDHLLELETVPEGPALRRPHVLYEFEDESLESLSVGHKILIRTGPEHASAVRLRLVEVRERLTNL